MSEVELEPDPIVRTALQRLPIPSHTDGFWARLEVALDAEVPATDAVGADSRTVLVAVPAGATGPEAEREPQDAAREGDPTLALVPRSMRRTSNGVLLAVAAATILVVALASSSLLEERNGNETASPGGTVQPSASIDALATEPASLTPDTLSSDGAAASSDAVLAWVDDLGSGDGAAAWEAMGQASQAHFGSQDAFAAEMSSFVDDYDAWAGAEPDDLIVTPVRDTEAGALAVVTLVGRIDQGGGAGRRTDALPVRLVDGEAVVEPFAPAGQIEVVVPEPAPAGGASPPVAADEELVIVVPLDAQAPVLRLDDGDTVVCGEADGTELVDLEGSTGRRCSYRPAEGMDVGEHTLTVALVGPDGDSISAGSVRFDAAA